MILHVCAFLCRAYVLYRQLLVFRWKHDFCREALLPIVNEVTCAVIAPTYSTVLRVDKLCRACTFPSKLQFVDFSGAPLEVLLQSQQLFMMQELGMEHPIFYKASQLMWKYQNSSSDEAP